MNFSPKRATEKEVFTVDFAPLLAPGDAVLSAVWSISPVDGQDATASSMIQGDASRDGSMVSQLIVGGVPGVMYAPICTAQTVLGETLVLPEVGFGLLYIAG